MHPNIKSKIKKKEIPMKRGRFQNRKYHSNIHKSHKRFKRMNHNESTNLDFHRRALLPFTYQVSWKQWWVPNILVSLQSTKSFKDHISRLGSRPSASDYQFGTLAITKCESVCLIAFHICKMPYHTVYKKFSLNRVETFISKSPLDLQTTTKDSIQEPRYLQE